MCLIHATSSFNDMQLHAHWQTDFRRCQPTRNNVTPTTANIFNSPESCSWHTNHIFNLTQTIDALSYTLHTP